jgi:hypothetical protein
LTPLSTPANPATTDSVKFTAKVTS